MMMLSFKIAGAKDDSCFDSNSFKVFIVSLTMFNGLLCFIAGCFVAFAIVALNTFDNLTLFSMNE